MEKYRGFLRLIVAFYLICVLYFAFKAFITGWFDNLSVGTIMVILPAVASVVYFLVWPFVAWLFFNPEQKVEQ